MSQQDPAGTAEAASESRLLVRACQALIAVGAVMRVAVLAATTTYVPPDGLQYAHVARLILAGEWRALPAIPHYLYGAVTAAVTLGGMDPLWAGRVVSLLSGLALIGILGALGRRAGGSTVGWATAALASVFPPLVDYSTVLLSESLFLALAAAGVHASLRALEGESRKWGAAGGALLALAYLTRPEGFAVAAMAVALLAGFGLAARRGAWTSATGASPLQGALAMAAAFALLISPYVLLLHAVHGRWILSGYQIHEGARALTGALGVRAAQSLAVGSDILYSAFDPNPVIRAMKVVRRAYLEGIPWLVPPLVFLLAGAGLAHAFRRGGGHRWLFLAPFTVVAPLFAAFTLPLVVPRYYLLTAAVLLPFAGAGVARMARVGRAVGVAALLIVVVSLVPDLWRLPATADRPPQSLLGALRDLRAEAPGALATNSWGLLYLSRMDAADSLIGRIRTVAPDSLTAGLDGGGSYLAIQLRDDPTYHHGWDALGSAHLAPPGMRWVGAYPAVGGPFVLYRIERPGS